MKTRMKNYILIAGIFVFASCLNQNKNQESSKRVQNTSLAEPKEQAYSSDSSISSEKTEDGTITKNMQLTNAIVDSNKIQKKNPKELRYLFAANGGMLGYLTDGTVVGCPKCDFITNNIKKVLKWHKAGTYKVQMDGSLLVNGSEELFPNTEDGWVLIDYEWQSKPETYQ